MSTKLGQNAITVNDVDTVIAGPVVTSTLLMDSTVPALKGQVVKYDSSAHNWAPFTSWTAGDIMAVFYDDNLHVDAGTALGADTYAVAIVGGEVNRYALDTTSLAADAANGDLEAGMRQNGIYLRGAVSA
jgi:hypothetical protein